MRTYHVKLLGSRFGPGFVPTWQGEVMSELQAVVAACDEYKLTDEERLGLRVKVRPLPSGVEREYVTTLALRQTGESRPGVGCAMT